MWNWRHFVALIAVFAAGLGAGMLVSSAPDGVTSARSGPPTHADPDGLAAAAGPPPVQRTDQAEPTPPMQAAASPTGGLTAALRSIPYPELPTGEGTITGRVLDEEGAPVAGVAVALQPASADTDNHTYARGLDDPDVDPWTALEADVLHLAHRRLQLRHPERNVVTGPEGTFRFSGLPDEAHRLHCGHPGYQLVIPGRTGRFMPGAHVDVLALRCVTLLVRVEAPPQAQLEKCFALVSGGPRAELKQIVKRIEPGLWSYRLPPGSYAIGARYSGRPARGKTQIVTLARHEPERVVTVSLEWLPTIDVAVEFMGGVPMDTALVKLASPGSDAELSTASFRDVPTNVLNRTEQPHRFTHRFANVANGSLAVGVFMREQLIHAERIEHVDSLSAPTLRITAPAQHACINVVCRDRSGAPQKVTGFQLTAADQSFIGTGNVWVVSEGVIRVDPRFIVGARESASAPLTLRVTASTGQVRVVELSGLEPQTVNLTFSHTGPVLLSLTGGERQQGALGFQVVEDGQRWRVMNDSTDNTPGVTLLKAVPLGRTRIEVTRWTPLGHIPYGTADLQVEPSGSVAEIRLASSATLTIQAPRGVTAVMLTLNSSGQPCRLQEWRLNQLRVSQTLPSGDYTAIWRDPLAGELRTKQFYLQVDTVISLE